MNNVTAQDLAYVQGFITKCAEAGVDADQAAAMLKAAGAPMSVIQAIRAALKGFGGGLRQGATAAGKDIWGALRGQGARATAAAKTSPSSWSGVTSATPAPTPPVGLWGKVQNRAGDLGTALVGSGKNMDDLAATAISGEMPLSQMLGSSLGAGGTVGTAIGGGLALPYAGLRALFGRGDTAAQ
jgi:hypothetical protein